MKEKQDRNGVGGKSVANSFPPNGRFAGEFLSCYQIFLAAPIRRYEVVGSGKFKMAKSDCQKPAEVQAIV